VAEAPIRTSRRSAAWCIATIERVWEVKAQAIAATEREEAKATFDRVIERYRQIATESPPDS
jgi:hypothetical protein